jgi:hypothetical protein
LIASVLNLRWSYPLPEQDGLGDFPGRGTLFPKKQLSTRQFFLRLLPRETRRDEKDDLVFQNRLDGEPRLLRIFCHASHVVPFLKRPIDYLFTVGDLQGNVYAGVCPGEEGKELGEKNREN